MELNNFMEIKPHGNSEYSFEQYKMKRTDNCIFVTNHWHKEIEIIYVLHGDLYININGSDFVGKSGDVFLVNKSEMHELYGKSLDLEYYAFVFNDDMLSFASRDASQRLFLEPIAANKIKFSNKPKTDENIFKQILECNRGHSFAYMLKTKSLLLYFISGLFESGQYEKRRVESSSEELKKKIIYYIKSEFAGKITLGAIAEKFNMSPKYFCRFFKNSFGKTFTEYLNGVRTEKAMEFLDKGESVTAAALSCGFNNMSYFTRVFRSNTGINPCQYKRRLNKD